VAARYAARLETDFHLKPARAACLRGEPSLETVLDGCGGQPIVVLPLLMAEGYILDWLKRRLDAYAAADTLLLPPVGADAGLAPILHRMAREEAQMAGWRLAETTLLLIGHGTPRHPASGRTLEAQAVRLRAAGGLAAVESAYLEQEPRLEERARALSGRPVVACGFFVDAGPHGRGDVEAILAGFPSIRYAGVVGERPQIVQLLARIAQPAFGHGLQPAAPL
jgi:sirohydrochlorin cobaltochelatase